MAINDRNQKLAADYEAGASVDDLAKASGLAASTIRGILSALGASRAASQEARRGSISKAIHGGMKAKDVAKEHGVSLNWARRVAKASRREPPETPSNSAS